MRGSETHMSIDLQKAERSTRGKKEKKEGGREGVEGNLAWWKSITNSANHESIKAVISSIQF